MRASGGAQGAPGQQSPFPSSLPSGRASGRSTRHPPARKMRLPPTVPAPAFLLGSGKLPAARQLGLDVARRADEAAVLQQFWQCRGSP